MIYIFHERRDLYIPGTAGFIYTYRYIPGMAGLYVAGTVGLYIPRTAGFIYFREGGIYIPGAAGLYIPVTGGAKA